MEPATPAGETPAPVAPSNEPSTVSAPVVDNTNVDVEAAKKEAEQARIRANQLQNELEKVKAEKEAADRKKLEEKEEFKTLYEQTQSRLAEIEAEQTARERAAELKGETEKVFADYPSNVVEIARTAGLSLSDDSEEALKSLKDKLDTFKAQVGTPTPTPNNPRPQAESASKEELMQRMRGGDKAATHEYIRELPAIKRMKEIANGQF